MKTVKIFNEDGIRTIMISRPKQRNAFTDELAFELIDSFNAASKDPTVKCVILTGDPTGNAFCAGADLGGNGEQFRQKDNNQNPSRRVVSLATHRDSGGIVGLSILECTKPVICALNGSAVGVGMTMACCCDLRVVVADAKVGFPFVRRGLACETISSWTLSKLVGLGQAQELVLTGRVFTAKDSPMGLFNYILQNTDQVLKKAKELANEIKQNASPFSLALSKAMIIRNGNVSPEEAHLIESKAIFACAGSEDNVEGIMSFLEKRAPTFKSNGWSSLPDFYPWWNPLRVKSNL